MQKCYIVYLYICAICKKSTQLDKNWRFGMAADCTIPKHTFLTSSEWDSNSSFKLKWIVIWRYNVLHVLYSNSYGVFGWPLHFTRGQNAFGKSHPLARGWMTDRAIRETEKRKHSCLQKQCDRLLKACWRWGPMSATCLKWYTAFVKLFCQRHGAGVLVIFSSNFLLMGKSSCNTIQIWEVALG